MSHKGLLFDLDGVIVDTAKYHFLAWKELCEELQIPFTEKENELLKGVSRVRSFQIILELGNREMSDKQQEYYRNQKNDRYVSYISKLEKEEILPGVREFIEHAKEQGYQVALGSASKNAVIILERLELMDLFDAIIDGTKVAKAKPDPEVFTKGADALHLEYTDCIVFEDSAAGIEAAQAVGMAAIGIGEKENLPKSDVCIAGFDGVQIEDIENMWGNK